jgi:hypothetical protein
MNSSHLKSFSSQIYLSGVNYAWDNYGYDFGDSHYVNGARTNYEKWLQEVAAAGGNAISELASSQSQLTRYHKSLQL